jgi:hypothetical protein
MKSFARNLAKVKVVDCKICGRPFRRGRQSCDRRECWPNRFPAVYRFVCPDGRSYVGAVGNCSGRGDSIQRSNARLLAAFELHPPETWTFEVLEQLPPGCSMQTRREAEQRHIERLRSWLPEFGFNMLPAAWSWDGPAQHAGRQQILTTFAAAQQKKNLRQLEIEATEPVQGGDVVERVRHNRAPPPPPASFSLQDLPDDAQLTEAEVAAVGRWSTNTVASWRRRPDHPLEWEYVAGGFVRYRAGKLKIFMAMPPKRRGGGPSKRRPEQTLSSETGHGIGSHSAQPSPKEVADQQREIRELSARMRKARKLSKRSEQPRPDNVGTDST